MNITRIIFIIGTTVHLYACLQQDTLWMKDPGAPNVVCPNDAIHITHVHSVSHCGGLCSSETGCTSFTYDSSLNPNCYLMAVEPPSTAGCLPATNAKHYKPPQTVSEYTCHPNDETYRTYFLSDGQPFTYRIVHSLVDAPTASAACESSGGFLAKVSTVARLRWLYYIMQMCTELGFGHSYYYIGGSNAGAEDYFASDAWTWLDGDQVNMNSTFWAAGRPNWPEEAHCMVIEGGDYNWKFNDDVCTYSRNYICEKP